MSDKSKRIFILLVSSVVVILLFALIGIGAFALGRNSAIDDEKAIITVIADGPLVGVEDSGRSEDDEATSTGQKDDDRSLSQNASNGQDRSSDVGDPGASPEEAAVGEEQTTEPQVRVPVDLEAIDLELMHEVWEIINEKFDGSLPSSSEVTYGAIMGSMDLLDDKFTRFIPPDIAERFRIQLQGGYEGIGAYVDLNDEGYLVIVRPIDGFPADKAGLLSDDIVTHVDGQSILGMPRAQIVAMVTGPEGTSVTLRIRRDSTGETLDVTIMRERIDFPVVSSEMLDDDVAYVRLTSFTVGADHQLSEAIEALLIQEPRGLILDLRDNPGGLLSQSISIGDLFLSKGIVAYQRDSDGVEKVFESDDGDLAEEIPLVLLVNKGSASGSEIVAGAIHDLGRGILIGEQTLGKGSVQQSYPLSDGSELRVTIARWYTPNNETIDDQGIIPDITVETPEDLGGDDDTQLQRAIKYLLEGE